MSMKDTYVKKLQSKLDEWNAEIDKLKAKADVKEADARQEYYKQIDELKSMKEGVRKKLDELSEAGDDAWEDLKAGADRAWESASRAFSSAMSRFK